MCGNADAHQLRMEESNRDRPAPRRGGAKADECLHGERAVTQCAQCARVEAPADRKLNDGGGHNQDPVDALHADEGPRLQHQHRRTYAECRGDDPVAQKSSRLFGTRGNQLGIKCGARLLCIGVPFTSGEGECGGGNLVSSCADHRSEISNARCLWRVLNGGHRGRKVHARPAHAVGLLQESLHAVHARGAGHPSDGEGNLRHGSRWCRRSEFG